MNLYRLARIVNNAKAVTHPSRLPRRVKNVVVGRALGRLGIWRWLWR